MQPIAGYNFGAQQYHRVNQVMKTTVIIATIITTSGFIVGELMPGLAVSAFTTDQTLIQMSAERTKDCSGMFSYYRFSDGYF